MADIFFALSNGKSNRLFCVQSSVSDHLVKGGIIMRSDP